ncbi:hypothetical protein BOTBODRAFT_38280 [Botryobasidium botryosum FD-172 SS1]|uniref:Uncharacterized protein n=1 Tax=Botryobasidium botryosum (strain FD-172 SS1) TaxID=930990 RepID=A0A067M8Z4_BOTB1|nr:hypothetical protein BOTBODRAFT_38280 [Botryobasidium botryosum FD-172 SS1]
MSKKLTPTDASRIQSALVCDRLPTPLLHRRCGHTQKSFHDQARAGCDVGSGSLAAHAQSTAAKNDAINSKLIKGGNSSVA